MNKTLSFIKLDFLTIKPYLTIKNLLILILLFGFIGYGTGSGAMIIGMLMMYATFYVSYPFAVAEKSSMDTLYASLPITKRDIVFGRYVFALITNIMAGVISFLIAAGIMLIFKKEFSPVETVFTGLVCFILYTLIQAIQIPIFFSIGYTKAKMWSYLPLAGFPAAVAAASAMMGKDKFLPMLNRLVLWLQDNIILAAAIIIIFWVAAMGISLAISYRMYRKREF